MQTLLAVNQNPTFFRQLTDKTRELVLQDYIITFDNKHITHFGKNVVMAGILCLRRRLFAVDLCVFMMFIYALPNMLLYMCAVVMMKRGWVGV